MAPARPSNRTANAALALGSVVLTLLAVESGLRLASGRPLEPPAPRHADTGLELLDSPYPASFDAELGHVPTPGASGRANVWGTRVTITAEGMRSNGHRAGEGVPIIAVGDSFTFGDEVNDDETWPAQLEGLVGRPVVNAGVFGYGLDQIVLRAESLLESTPSDLMIVALIGDSVARCEYAYRYAWKPYFELDGRGLRLRNVPVPEPTARTPASSAVARWMRGSHLLYFVGSRLDPDRWLTPDSIRVHDDGPEVAVRLIERLSEQARRRGIQLVWVLLWHPGADNQPALPAIRRAQQLGDAVIALGAGLREQMPVLESGQGRDPSHLFHILPSGRSGHLSAAGNAEVARMLAEPLVEHGLLVAAPPPSQPGSGRGPVE